MTAMAKALQSTWLYYDDMKTFIGPLDAVNPNNSRGDWMGAMLSYYGNATNILICPSAPDKGNPANKQNPAGKSDQATPPAAAASVPARIHFDGAIAGESLGLQSLPDPFSGVALFAQEHPILSQN